MLTYIHVRACTHKVMKRNFITGFFIVFSLIYVSKSEEFGSTTRTTIDILFSDIRNAFKTVTNNTNLINHLISKMYQPVMEKSKFTFSFEIPDSDAKNGYSMWMMERSELIDPTFPNLTLEYMSAQLHKNRVTSEESEVLETESGHNTQLQANTWSALGLDGWSGAIVPVHADADTSEAYPTSDILMELENPDSENAVDDENVYIARVNDPFGTSVKWQLRNSTDRTKRDVLTLYSMIQCSTGCQPIIYKGYGCYCGFSGAGVPVDGIDRCCKLHDKCYEYSNCISYLEYFVPYIWKCYRHKPLCAIDHGEFGGPGSCAARLCQCDLKLSRCLRRFTCPRRRAVCFSSKARRLQNFLLTF